MLKYEVAELLLVLYRDFGLNFLDKGESCYFDVMYEKALENDLQKMDS